MLVKDHEQKSSLVTIHNRRVQRCLSFAVVFIFVAMVVIKLYKEPWPKPTQLHLDTITGLHKYTSSPEAGMPALPFHNNARRKASEEPFFDTGEDEEEDDDDDDGIEELEAQKVLTREVLERFLTREQLENIGPEGILIGIGVH